MGEPRDPLPKVVIVARPKVIFAMKKSLEKKNYYGFVLLSNAIIKLQRKTLVKGTLPR